MLSLSRGTYIINYTRGSYLSEKKSHMYVAFQIWAFHFFRGNGLNWAQFSPENVAVASIKATLGRDNGETVSTEFLGPGDGGNTGRVEP